MSVPGWRLGLEAVVDEQRAHVYELDIAEFMAELKDTLTGRGYEVSHSEGSVWRFRTRWSRGAAYGEIGSIMYALLERRLKDVG